jgi:hypothetical protein
MELLDIIVTSISLFTIGAVFISIVSYIIYKYRNKDRIKPYEVVNPAPQLVPVAMPVVQEAERVKEEDNVVSKKNRGQAELRFVPVRENSRRGYERRNNGPKIQVMNFRNEEYREAMPGGVRPVGIYGDFFDNYESGKYSQLHKLKVAAFK